MRLKNASISPYIRRTYRRGRPPIMKVTAAPQDAPWLWTLAFGYHEDRTPTHG
jgi:hypothetical protein